MKLTPVINDIKKYNNQILKIVLDSENRDDISYLI